MSPWPSPISDIAGPSGQPGVTPPRAQLTTETEASCLHGNLQARQVASTDGALIRHLAFFDHVGRRPQAHPYPLFLVVSGKALPHLYSSGASSLHLGTYVLQSFQSLSTSVLVGDSQTSVGSGMEGCRVSHLRHMAGTRLSQRRHTSVAGLTLGLSL